MPPFRDHFSVDSAGYAEGRPAYPRELVEWLATLTERRSLAWDAGCGSGQLSILLAGRFQRVVASDASFRQISEAPYDPRVRYLVARSEASGLRAGTVDLAVAAQAAHWFDFPDYLAEVKRVARPGAAIALISYGRPRLPGALDPLIQELHTGILGRYWPAERRHVEEEYRTLPFPFEEVQDPGFLMEAAWDLGRFRRYVETWSAVHRLRRETGALPLDDLFDRLAAAWGDVDSRHPIRWPMAVRAGRTGRP